MLKMNIIKYSTTKYTTYVSL